MKQDYNRVICWLLLHCVFLDTLALDYRSVVQRLKKCKSEYQTLGIFLHLDPALISKFETFTGDCSRCLLILLDDYLRDKGPKVTELCQGVVGIDRKLLADDLERKYRSEFWTY